MQSVCVYDKVVTSVGKYTCIRSGQNNKGAKSHQRNEVLLFLINKINNIYSFPSYMALN